MKKSRSIPKGKYEIKISGKATVNLKAGKISVKKIK